MRNKPDWEWSLFCFSFLACEQALRGALVAGWCSQASDSWYRKYSQFLLGGLLGESREKIVLDKKDAFNFFSTLKSSINHECYEEDCTFGEVVDHYGSSEQTVGLHRRTLLFSVNFHFSKEETDSKLRLFVWRSKRLKKSCSANESVWQLYMNKQFRYTCL